VNTGNLDPAHDHRSVPRGALAVGFPGPADLYNLRIDSYVSNTEGWTPQGRAAVVQPASTSSAFSYHPSALNISDGTTTAEDQAPPDTSKEGEPQYGDDFPDGEEYLEEDNFYGNSHHPVGNDRTKRSKKEKKKRHALE